MTLALYLSGHVLRRVLGALAVLTLMGLTLDLFANGADVAAEGGAAALAEYAALRLPMTAVTLAPPSVLLGGALAFLALAMRSELTAVRSAGAGTGRLLAMLIPLALALGGGYSLLEGRLAPALETRLSTRFPAAAEIETASEDLWLRGASAVMHVGSASADGRRLSGVVVYRLDAEGRIAGRIQAAEAERAGEAWRLSQVRMRPLGGPETTRETLRWTSGLGPGDIRRFGRGGGAGAGAREAAAVLSGDIPAVRGEAYYRTGLLRSYAAWLTPAVLLLLTVRSGFALPRARDGTAKAAVGVGLGFLFIAVDGFAAAMAESGAVSAPLAVFGPLAAFAAIGVWSVVMHEG